MNNQHAHSELLKALIQNMDLVVLKDRQFSWCKSTPCDLMADSLGEDNFFLCHPRHVVKCIDSLNGSAEYIPVSDREINGDIETLWRDGSIGFKEKKAKKFELVCKQSEVLNKTFEDRESAETVREFASNVFAPLEFEVVEILA